jgi:hypothetical protein
VRPAARIPIEPDEFPLLADLTGFEPMYGSVDPIRLEGLPFMDEARSYLVRPRQSLNAGRR